MYIKHLSLLNFKNYESIELDFCLKINCFIGNNGVGKTNLLDAIHYLCLSKSYFTNLESDNILHSKDFAVIQGHFMDNDTKNEVYCGIQRNKRKILKKNKKEYSKIADHIGQFPLVMISPSDIKLIIDAGEERRKYLNSVISQYDRVYLDNTIKYNKIIQQRNKALKELYHSNNDVKETIEIYNEQLIPLSTYIYDARKNFTNKLIPIFQSYYDNISNHKEEVELKYMSDLQKDSMDNLLKNSFDKDKILQYTTKGIHRDDISLYLHNKPIKKIGSQGQQKTYLVALKLAQYDFLKEISEKKPILLLDDIFDKFDAQRVQQIVKIVSDDKFGQIFITHTSLDRMRHVLNDIKIENYLYFIEDNKIRNL